MSSDFLSNDGLQAERTALAWRRTGLSFAATSMVAVRILPELLGVWSVVPAGLGFLVSLVIIALAHRRHHAVHQALTDPDPGRQLPSGLLPLATTVLALIGGVVALVIVLSRVLSRW